MMFSHNQASYNWSDGIMLIINFKLWEEFESGPRFIKILYQAFSSNVDRNNVVTKARHDKLKWSENINLE